MHWLQTASVVRSTKFGLSLSLWTSISFRKFTAKTSYKHNHPYKNLQHQATLKSSTPKCLKRTTEASRIQRPSPGYQPTTWSYDFVKSLNNHYSGDIYKERAKKLEEEVRIMIEDEGKSSLELLELIDDIERLGLGYCFKEDIRRALNKIVSLKALEQDVYATALKFRLLRQHGYEVSEDVFRRFLENKDDFILVNDVKGLLCLYEASFLAIKGETLLDEAKSFATMQLKNLNNVPIDTSLMEHVNHALELPLHHRVQRVEARRYIDAYKNKKGAIQCLLELAILDFNVLQSTFQGDLQEASRWWKNTGLASKLSFIRDRLMEGFFFTTGIAFEPQYSKCRIGLTKVIAFITSIDDVYDSYGSLNELEQFTDAVERWDIEAVQHLPGYILKICFLALYNTVNELAYHTLIEQGKDVSLILRKTWADLCQAFLVEAKWNQKKCTPTLEDYLDNGWRSVSGVVILVHVHFLTGQEMTNETPIDFLQRHHDLLKWASMIFRLCNDLATSTAELERGETANSIVCYMRESGVSEENARKHIRNLIDEAWMKLNQYLVADSPFVKTAVYLARLAECLYEYGDGHGAPDSRAKKRVFSAIVQPIDYS